MGIEMQSFVNNVNAARDANSDGGAMISAEEYGKLQAEFAALPKGFIFDGRASAANEALGNMATTLIDSLKQGHTYEQFKARSEGYASRMDQLGI